MVRMNRRPTLLWNKENRTWSIIHQSVFKSYLADLEGSSSGKSPRVSSSTTSPKMFPGDQRASSTSHSNAITRSGSRGSRAWSLRRGPCDGARETKKQRMPVVPPVVCCSEILKSRAVLSRLEAKVRKWSAKDWGAKE